MLHYMIKKSSFVKKYIPWELNFTLPWDLTDGISSFYATYLMDLDIISMRLNINIYGIIVFKCHKQSKNSYTSISLVYMYTPFILIKIMLILYNPSTFYRYFWSLSSFFYTKHIEKLF